MKPIFSTVACPDWTLSRIAAAAEAAGYLGVELRTFGSGSTRFAGDPALTAPEKTRQTFAQRGIEIACLATGVRFDARQSLIAHALSTPEPSVGEVKWAVDLAARLETPLVRVFGFEFDPSERRSSALARICDRLTLAVATARNTGVRLVVENGGSFATAATLAELLDRVDHPLLGFAYSPAVGAQAGETLANALNVLGERILAVKLRDYKAGVPCVLGDGDLNPAAAVHTLAEDEFKGYVVVEHEAAWLNAASPRSAAETERMLTISARRVFEWMGTPTRPATGARAVRM